MKLSALKPIQESKSNGFDLFRLQASKDIVDISPNTLRSYNREGLPFYRKGRSVFVSKSELDEYIRSTSK